MRQAFKVVLIFNDLIAYNDECFMRFWGHFNLFWEFSIHTEPVFKIGSFICFIICFNILDVNPLPDGYMEKILSYSTKVLLC